MDISSAYSILSNVYANASKAAGCFYVYSYRPEYDAATKRTVKKDVKSIGKIETKDGFGQIILNNKFLKEYPDFVDFKVERTAFNKIHIELRKSKKSQGVNASDLLQAGHMKIGATYFIVEVFKRSYSGRALKALYDNRVLTKTQYEQLLTLFIYSIYEGVKRLGAIEYFIRDHIVPFSGFMNKDTVQRLYPVLSDTFIVAFYKKKQEIMRADLSKLRIPLATRKYIALDGSNIDVNSNNISNADYGNSKSGNDVPIVNFLALIEQTTGTIFGHCSYSGHTNDIATLEGSVKQLAYFGCDKYNLIVDRGYWSTYNVSVMYNLDIDFIMHVKISHNAIKKFIKNNIDDLAVGNGCVKIEQENEVNYACKFKLMWSFYNVKAQAKQRKPIYLYAFYNPAIAQAYKSQLKDEAIELNRVHNEYKENLAKAVAQHKKKPTQPKLTERQQDLIDDGIISFNTQKNRYDLNNAKVSQISQENGVWLLASTQEYDCEEIFMRYRQRNEIEVMYRYFKNHVQADTLRVSNDDHFNAKLFLGLISSEFLNTLKMRIVELNKDKPKKDQVKLKDNSMYMTFKDLDTVECIYHNNTIIHTTNILKRHENLFNMMGIDPIVLQNTKLKRATLDNDIGLVE